MSTHDEKKGTVHPQELDPGLRDYLIYELYQSSTLIGKVLVTRTAGGGYDANREYWYMTTNVSMNTALSFVSSAEEGWSNPPSGLGTLSFVTARTPQWTSASPPSSMLLKINALTGEKIGIDWKMFVSHGVWNGSIDWWHSNTNDLFGPSATNVLSPDSTPSGTWYRYTTSPL
jgi:hypothetical protein